MRIPFDSLTLMCVSDEARRSLLRGRIQRVSQPGALDLALTIRNGGANHVLILSADPVFARAHLTVKKPTNPPRPPAFCMMCRKHLEGGFVTDIRQRDFDRILDIQVDCEGRMVLLTAELMGKHSNLFLVSESGMILDAIKRVTRRQNRFRELLPGVPYLPPPEPAGKESPFTATTSDLDQLQRIADTEAVSARLMARFAGLSPFLADELVLRAEQTSLNTAWEEIFGAASEGAWMPVVIRGDDHRPVGAYPFPTIQVPPDHQHGRSSISTALEHHFGAAVPLAETESLRNALATEIDRALSARQRKRESLQRSLEEAGRAAEYRRAGELLLANLHRMEPGAESAVVGDYFEEGSPLRAIPLDSRKSPAENAEAYFRRYRKSKDAAEMQRGFRDQIDREVKILQGASETLRGLPDAANVKDLRRALESEGALRGASGRSEETRKTTLFQGKKIRVFTTPEGWEVLVGENSEANDFLTTRVAAPNDLWLHVRAAPSAHVVIRTRNEPARVPLSVIKQAAILAARHSAAKHSETVPVDYTLKKHVRRPRGAAPGAVHYQNEKTVHVSPRER